MHKNRKYIGLWYIALDGCKYLWKDLKIHNGTYKRGNRPVREKASGYYSSKRKAEIYLRLFKEKHNMNDLIVIQVEVNGKKVPLHEISVETLLTIRENSKPKEIPVARTAECSGHKYLLLKMPPNSGKYENKVVVIELEMGYVNGSWPVEKEQDNTYLDCVYSYKNVQVIS